MRFVSLDQPSRKEPFVTTNAMTLLCLFGIALCVIGLHLLNHNVSVLPEWLRKQLTQQLDPGFPIAESRTPVPYYVPEPDVMDRWLSRAEPPTFVASDRSISKAGRIAR